MIAKHHSFLFIEPKFSKSAKHFILKFIFCFSWGRKMIGLKLGKLDGRVQMTEDCAFLQHIKQLASFLLKEWMTGRPHGDQNSTLGNSICPSVTDYFCNCWNKMFITSLSLYFLDNFGPRLFLYFQLCITAPLVETMFVWLNQQNSWEFSKRLGEA